jgi:hypothetical protein
MNIKKLIRYREKFNSYLKKADNSHNTAEKLTVYNKILRIIQKLKFFEQKGKVSIEPPLIKIEKIFLKSKEDISD